nr:RluA family pseudouridine synthase [Brevibacillus fulvus]
MTVEQIIRGKLAVSGRMLQRLTRSKGIQLNRKPPFLGRQVKEGDRVSVRIAERTPSAKETTAQPSARLAALDILFEDEFYLIVNKRAGMMTHPINKEQTETLVDVVRLYLQGKGETGAVHPVHRLDKQTSGAVLLAKNSYAHQLADRALRNKDIRREYLAVLSGHLSEESGTIAAPIGRDHSHPTKRRVVKQGEPAVTHFQVVARSEQFTLVRIELETGRTHQIRVHFQHLGYPLLGDTLYGGEKGLSHQALHAIALSFIHPVHKQEVSVEAALPKDLAEFLARTFPSHTR